MNVIKKIIIVFIVIFCYRLISNIVNFIVLAYISNNYDKWIEGEENLFILQIPFLNKTIKKSGHSLLYIDVRDSSNHQSVNNICTSSMSIFVSRIVENFNPLFWIDTVIHLPKSMFVYLGIPAETTIVKIFQILWWIITPVALLFRENLSNYILNLF